ncbi:hypothetical protein C7M84_023709 [Penaeus vannamei]|uniref:VWFD domain-containing protein n=1 Tax=Penaeus vannamei TaxID=6689 RepID=A0A3R7QLU6_PENVA|nr:hypothetical protein C7M84_023709 [Penaeus vannamei]
MACIKARKRGRTIPRWPSVDRSGRGLRLESQTHPFQHRWTSLASPPFPLPSLAHLPPLPSPISSSLSPPPSPRHLPPPPLPSPPLPPSPPPSPSHLPPPFPLPPPRPSPPPSPSPPFPPPSPSSLSLPSPGPSPPPYSPSPPLAHLPPPYPSPSHPASLDPRSQRGSMRRSPPCDANHRGRRCVHYSAVQEGTGYNPDSFVSVEFDPHATVAGFVDRTDLVFKDTGADPVTCPASDIQGCSFGPVTETPKEINDVGTLALTTQLGSLTFNAIVGVNKITTLYTDNSLLILAPTSKYEELGGLCGEYNGDPSDDLTIRDGTVTTDSAAFVTDWKMDPTCVSTPAARELKSMTDSCASLTPQTLSELTLECENIISTYMNVTEPMMNNCKQILCQCELIDVESCLPSLQELSATIAQVHKKEKSPSDLEELLQGSLV